MSLNLFKQRFFKVAFETKNVNSKCKNMQPIERDISSFFDQSGAALISVFECPIFLLQVDFVSELG